MLSLSLAYNRIFFCAGNEISLYKRYFTHRKNAVKLSSTFFEYETDISFNTINPESKIMEDTDKEIVGFCMTG